MTFNSNKYLKCVLDSHAVEREEEVMRTYRRKRDEVQKLLEARYGGDLYSPVYSGFYVKRTAISSTGRRPWKCLHLEGFF